MTGVWVWVGLGVGVEIGVGVGKVGVCVVLRRCGSSSGSCAPQVCGCRF